MYSLQFSKKFPLPTYGGHFEFSNFCPKLENTNLPKPCKIVISVKFSTHRVSKKGTLGNFQKIFLFPKMAAILNFRIFAKNRKTEICFYLLNHAIQSDFVKIFDLTNAKRHEAEIIYMYINKYLSIIDIQMKQGLVRLLYNFGKRFMRWTLHMIMCVLLCYPLSIHMSLQLSTGRPISSFSI